MVRRKSPTKVQKHQKTVKGGKATHTYNRMRGLPQIGSIKDKSIMDEVGDPIGGVETKKETSR